MPSAGCAGACAGKKMPAQPATVLSRGHRTALAGLPECLARQPASLTQLPRCPPVSRFRTRRASREPRESTSPTPRGHRGRVGWASVQGHQAFRQPDQAPAQPSQSISSGPAGHPRSRVRQLVNPRRAFRQGPRAFRQPGQVLPQPSQGISSRSAEHPRSGVRPIVNHAGHFARIRGHFASRHGLRRSDARLRRSLHQASAEVR